MKIKGTEIKLLKRKTNEVGSTQTKGGLIIS